MSLSKKRPAFDLFRFASAFLIVAIHTSPLESIDPTADFILTRIVARVAVPFFFMVSGYFLFSREAAGEKQYLTSFIKKVCALYGVAMLLCLPLNIYNGYFNLPAVQILKDILLNGTLYHLWYLPAVAAGALIAALLIRKLGYYGALAVSAALYLIGLGGDSYYGLSSQAPFLKTFYDAVFSVVDYTRNGLFFAPLFIVLGAYAFRKEDGRSGTKLLAGFICSLALMLAEGLLLHKFQLQRHDSMYLSLVPCMYFLFGLLKKADGAENRKLRTASTVVYIVHPLSIVLLRGYAGYFDLWALLVENSLLHYAAVCAISVIAAIAFVLIWGKVRTPRPSKDGRAWLEIDLSALRHNVKVLEQALPAPCRLMAVVKANAYGHGAVAVAKELEKSGVCAFAVATLYEGIELRLSGIKGEILILGYTSPVDAGALVRYRLSQTVVDGAYAGALCRAGKKISVHIAVDTGMNRLGVDSSDIAEIERIFACGNLTVKGMFSHLSSADSLSDDDVLFTRLQIARFFETADHLREKGYNTGSLHIQASYGILNYPDLTCDFARAGIALYGVLSTSGETKLKPDLKPVLSLKARVAEVRWIGAGESVSYGRTFIAEAPMKIAAVTIGYADGIPRDMLESRASVLLHTRKAPVIGRICMDMLMIDVTAIDGAEPGDIVTIIGRDGPEQIRCEEVAESCRSITNEILSRLGSRLPHIFI